MPNWIRRGVLTGDVDEGSNDDGVDEDMSVGDGYEDGEIPCADLEAPCVAGHDGEDFEIPCAGLEVPALAACVEPAAPDAVRLRARDDLKPFLPHAVPIPGLQHIIQNMLKDVHMAMSHWDKFFQA